MIRVKEGDRLLSSGPLVPVPDPTSLTTDQLRRETLALRELLEARLSQHDALFKNIETTFDNHYRDRREQIGHLQRLQDEKFHSIENQFTERDARYENRYRDNKEAILTAMAAAKDVINEHNLSSSLATTKAETSTLKQIEQIGLILKATTDGLNSKIDDIKDRLNQLEGKRSGSSAIIGYVIGGLGLLAGLLSAVLNRLS